MTRVSPWLRQFAEPRVESAPPLVICPHAGSGASAYRAPAKQMSDHFDVTVFQYPGRQDRIRDPYPATLPDMAAGAFADFTASGHNTGAPITLFGHSMGANVAFEIVRLAEAAGIEVRLLAVASAVAPLRIADLPPHPTEDDDALLRYVSALNGTDAEVMGSAAVMRMTLPVIKQDYRLFDSYTCPANVTVAAPIHAMGGDADPVIGARELYEWAAHTTGALQVTQFDGHHFFLNDNAGGVTELLAAPPTGRVR